MIGGRWRGAGGGWIAVACLVVACARGGERTAAPPDGGRIVVVTTDASPPLPAPGCEAIDCLPSFRARTIDGAWISTDDLRGKPALVLFWASWCEPCTQEGPSIDTVWRNHVGDGFMLLGVTRDELDDVGLRKFRDAHGLTFPIVRVTPEVDAAFGKPEDVPTFLLYAPDGHRALRMTGAMPAAILEREVMRLLPKR